MASAPPILEAPSFTLGLPSGVMSRKRTASGYGAPFHWTFGSSGIIDRLARTLPRSSTISSARPRNTGRSKTVAAIPTCGRTSWYIRMPRFRAVSKARTFWPIIISSRGGRIEDRCRTRRRSWKPQHKCLLFLFGPRAGLAMTSLHCDNRKSRRFCGFLINNERVMRASSFRLLVGGVAAVIPYIASAQVRAAQPAAPVTTTLLVPDRVWDGVNDAPHSGWAVLVTGSKIVAAGPRAQISVPAGADAGPGAEVGNRSMNAFFCYSDLERD